MDQYNPTPNYNYDPNLPSGDAYNPPPPERNTSRTVMIVVGILLILCCCCAVFSIFMYFYGGDWLTDQMGITRLIIPYLTV